MRNGKIEHMTLEQIMGDRFGRYSKSIIQERALPDIRDGLKPVQRRILFAMNKDGNTYDKGFRKSAKSVGNVMGNFHPHGDSSIYEALVRLSQDWKLREPLIEMHGNNGSMDGDPPAAMRYTEARLSKIAGLMLQDIDKDTVEMALNFDDTEKEPTVLPARIPNLLVNGATGISAGYATEIPTHNLSEVLDALIYLIKHPTASLDKLMEFIPGPDFPTGGIIQGIDGIRKAYQTGRGRVVVRAKTEIETLRGGRQQINVTEIPYEVNKAQLVKRINDLRLAKKVEGIAEARDETDRSGLRIAIELKRGANANGILNYLLKNTDLQINYNFNMVAIDDQRPMRVGLKRILTSYLEFQKEIIRRRTQYNLTKAQQRLHIVEGLIKALSILDKVIKTIRASKNRKDAKENLVKEYNFTPEQAEAIVTLQLYRLTNTDVTELEKEQEQLNSRINEYQLILTNENELAKVLTKEIRAIKKEFGNPRRTKIENHVEKLEIDTKVTVANEDVVVLVSHAGYIKRSSIRSFKASEAEENGLREDDYPLLIQQTNTLSHLFMFTNLGHIIYRPIHEIADARWKDTGEHISQTIGLADNEEIIKAMIFDKLDQPGTIIMGTSDGQVKQTAFNDYKPGSRYKSHASVAIKLRDNAQVVNVDYYEPTNENCSLLTISRQGYAVRYDVADVPVTGIRTAGVRAINLKDDDQVADQILVKDGQDIAVITQRGAFKEMPVDEIEVGARARRGELVLRRLKSHPHEIADFLAYDPDYQGAFEAITNRPAFQDIMATDHHLSSIKSNGTFVIDTDTQGEPVKLRLKQTNILTEEPVSQS
ncbi:DNA topoisomerase IV subunit A [Limosilactobacillus reuteri]|uniref:DNA topoisomerase 4 subunit A n=3 Tax=Limosilactobacillus reuteri TaxID=1598 RepID=A5VJM3_LIMRD|nr:DNA topoisomerase IV subunit A [Limosilactobacillus reuteri]ABQ83047.1 DNA topoisomerase IV subunit A [Limosilactobacillus reuteri subsp. reuteri]AKP01025.1 DNA topoisomerase IV subunit A [Limosilactobacillus reuteri]EEI08412.1 DNA topoisomerase IV, A subunit [Limosilactobacillus reuteri MM2-3]EGC15237.1 DNA topoisomerase IV, A subunit [Limosilactobacillus reuteri MM4-1A]KEK13896.1 DNA topoisomerase IV subunit A [Limosilactobacillus reuteri]